MKFAFLLPVLGLTVCAAAFAQPSGGFYMLKNKVSGQQVCSQNPISPDWVKSSGPFKDQDCKVLEKLEPARTDLPASPLDLAPKK